MKLYMVTTFAPLFKDCGKNKIKVRVFTGLTSARTHITKEKKSCAQHDEFTILLEELILKELKKEDLRAAFEKEDIIELIGTREKIFEVNSA